jgi:hypothetical protein
MRFDAPNGDGTMNVAAGRKPANKASLRGLKLPMVFHQPANNGMLQTQEREVVVFLGLLSVRGKSQRCFAV